MKIFLFNVKLSREFLNFDFDFDFDFDISEGKFFCKSNDVINIFTRNLRITHATFLKCGTLSILMLKVKNHFQFSKNLDLKL